MHAQALAVLGCWAAAGLLTVTRKRDGYGNSRLNRSKEAWPRPVLLLFIAVVADAPLCYMIYTALAKNLGVYEIVRNLSYATLPALLSTYYLWLHWKAKKEDHVQHPSGSQTPVQTRASAKAQDLTGTWVKDGQASDSMAAAIQLAQLNRLTRTAVRLIKGIQILQTGEIFEFAVFSIIGWFKVKETYLLNGQPHQEKRRDLRKGKHMGWVLVTEEGYIRLHLQWNEPYGGSGYDEFRLISSNLLHVVSHIEVHGQTAGYTTVYNRK